MANRQRQEGRGEDTGSAENAGGILMSWPWRLRRAIEPRRMVSRVLELDSQGDPGGGLRCPARRGGGDDSEEAGGEGARGARGKAVAAGVSG